MALEGTIKEFGLADIFQLIGLQSKTGILFLKGEAETVNVYFEDGNIVKVDESKRRPHLMLGQILVRKGKVNQDHVREALESQKTTGQKIGNALLSQGLINKDLLRDALTFQITEAVYSVFRWKGGDYKFDQDRVDYDRDTIRPISTEHILMDGVRQLDEWPQIAGNMPDETVVFKRKDGLVLPSEQPEEDRDKDIFAGDGDYKITPDIENVLKQLDGSKTVMEVIESSSLGEFDTCRIIVELINNGVILRHESRPEPAAPAQEHDASADIKAKPKAPPGAVPAHFNYLSYVFVLLAALIIVLQVTGTRKIMDKSKTGIEPLKEPFAYNIIQKTEHASLVFLFDFGQYPDNINNLANLDYIDSGDVSDPWGSRINLLYDDDGNLFSASAGRDRTNGTDDDILSSSE